MAQTTVYLRGIAKWAKLTTPDPKFKVYTLDLYPDDPSWELYHQTDLELKEREDDEGGKFIKIRRPVEKLIKGEIVTFGPPKTLVPDGDGVAELGDKLVGNGSRVVAKVVVYDTPKGKGHRLETVLVEELVEYDRGTVLQDEEYPF